MRLLLVLIAAMSVAAAACGGGDDDDASATNTPAASVTEEPSTAAATATSEAVPAESPAAGAEFAEEFRRLGEQALAATFHVTYDVTLTGLLPDNTEGMAAWYSEPPRSRFDLSTGSGRSTLVVSPDGNFLCESGSCTDDTTGEYDDALDEGFGGLVNGTRPTTRSEEQVAGYAVVCFDVEATREINFDVGRVCFNETGIPLVLEGYAADMSTGAALVATSVSTTVPPGAFDRP